MPEKKVAVDSVVKKEGLGLVIAAIFLSGEMAGSGVLALAAAMVGTGDRHTLTKQSVESWDWCDLALLVYPATFTESSWV